MAELYVQFYKLFPSDAAFWWQLAIEEKNHAQRIRDYMNQLGIS